MLLGITFEAIFIFICYKSNENYKIMFNHIITRSLTLISILFLFVQCENGNGGILPDPIVAQSLDRAITEDMVLEDNPDLDVDYIIDREIDIRANVQIEPGVVIEFERDAGFFVSSLGGTLEINGTANKPVTLRGTRSERGFWKGIYFASESSGNRMTFCEVLYAGSSPFDGSGITAAIRVKRARIQDCRIEHSGGYGIHATRGEADALQGFARDTIYESQQYPLYVSAAQVKDLDGASLFLDNRQEFVRIQAGLLLGEEHVWWKLSQPYYVTDGEIQLSNVANPGTGLTLKEGVQVYFERDAGIDVTSNSFFRTEGTPNARVQLQGKGDESGYWKGIFVQGPSVQNEMHHTDIMNGGSDSFSGLDIRTNIRIGAVGSCCDNAYLKLQDCNIQNSGRCGIHQWDGSTLIEENVSYSGNVTDKCD